MLDPEKALAAAQSDDVEPRNRLILRKIYADLRQGLGLSLGEWSGDGSMDVIFAVTRFGDDLFLVSARNDSRFHFSPALELERTKVRIGRYEQATLFTGKKLSSGAKEAWTVRPSKGETNGLYRIARSGELEENEFWRRYNASVVDQEATRQSTQNVKEMYENKIPQYHGLPVTIVSLTEEPGKLPEGPVIIDPPSQE